MSSITNSWSTSTRYASDDTTSLKATSAQLATAPSALDPDEFLSWTRADQVTYLTNKGVAAGGTLQIGPVGNSITAQRIADGALKYEKYGVGGVGYVAFTEDGEGRDSTAAERATSASLLDPRIFMAWKLADQVEYVKAKGGGPLLIGANIEGGNAAIRLTLADNVKTTGDVLSGTAGDALPIPYQNLLGSSSSGAINQASAEALFPTLNGTTSILDVASRPDGFGSANNQGTQAGAQALASQFASWHSAYQLEYTKQHATNGVMNISNGNNAPLLTAIVSQSDPTKIYIVQNLQKADFAKMSKADQDLVAGTAAFTAVAAKLGLVDIDTASIKRIYDPNPDTAQGYVDDVIYWIGVNSLAANQTNKKVDVPEADKKPFIDQLNILKEQLGTMGVLSIADLQSKVTAINDRWKRALAFYDVKSFSSSTTAMGRPDVDVTRYQNVISEDDNATINRGYAIFIAQEKRISEIAQARMQIVRDDGSLFGKQLDVPNLVYRLQSLYNFSLEAEVVMETEEINQQNALLKTYARMQDIVNKTLSSFEKVDEGKKGITGLGGVDDTPSISQADFKIISMFEDADGTGQRHPLEKLRGISRPTQDMFNQKVGFGDNNRNDKGDPRDNSHMDLNLYTHATWSTFGNRLSEAVTIVNQNSQIKMNDINTLDKERNRHFELANNALSKASEIISAIARS